MLTSLRLYLGTGCDDATGCDWGSLSNSFKVGCWVALILGLPRFLATITTPVSGSLLLAVVASNELMLLHY